MRAVPNSFQQLAGAFEGRSHAEVTAGQLLNIRLDGVDGEDFAERKAVNCHGWLVELEKPQSVQSSVDICVPQVRDEDTLVPVIIQRATRFKSVLERRIHSIVHVAEFVVKNVAKVRARPLPTGEAENDDVGGIQVYARPALVAAKLYAPDRSGVFAEGVPIRDFFKRLRFGEQSGLSCYSGHFVKPPVCNFFLDDVSMKDAVRTVFTLHKATQREVY